MGNRILIIASLVNEAIIAYTGLLWYEKGIQGKEDIDPYWRPETLEYTLKK